MNDPVEVREWSGLGVLTVKQTQFEVSKVGGKSEERERERPNDDDDDDDFSLFTLTLLTLVTLLSLHLELL